MKPVKIYIPLLILAILLSGCNLRTADPFDIGNARTYYESLNLDTPESAARTFISVFQRLDFLTVFMILSTESQWEWRTALLFNYGHIQRGNRVRFLDDQNIETNITGEQYWPEKDYSLFGNDKGEKYQSILPEEGEVEFDLFMKAAKQAHKLWIDLSGEVFITHSIKSQTVEGEDAVDVFCEIEGFDELVVVRMVQDSLNNDWRVYQVIAPGGNEEIIPWSYNARYLQAFVHSKATFAINPEQPRTYYESLDLFTPEDTVSTFLTALKRENYPAAWLIFSVQAQEEWKDQYASLQSTMFYREPEDWFNLYGEYFEFSMENRSGMWFDRIMQFAKEIDILPINIRGSINILRTEDSLTSTGETAVDVYTKIPGTVGEVIFRLTETPSGRWRVHQVIFPGGDEYIIPWSHPPE